MPEFDPETWALLLPWWAAAALVVVFVILAVFAFLRGGVGRTLGALGQFAVVLLALALGWGFLERLSLRDRADERRAIETRMAELTSRAIAPGSALACLDGAAGNVVEETCEKALFVSPEQVASAVAYVDARLTLLADVTDFSNRGDGRFGQALAQLRRAAEIDRYGLVAHVLATRDGCNADQCEALELLRNPAQVVANLKDRVFDAHVVRHSGNWDRKGPALAGAPGESAGAAQAAATQAVTPSVNVNFPSAISIPPVSIMNNEPGMSGQNGMDQQAKPDIPTPPVRRAKAAPRNTETTGAPIPIAPPQRPAAAPRPQ